MGREASRERRPTAASTAIRPWVSIPLRFTPQRLVATLQDTLPADTVFSLDAGNNRTWMAHFYQAQQAKTFFAPGGTAGMGWGLPAAVALKLVYPDRPVCCVTGDGGYMMTVNALSTAVQYDLPILCVVFQ